MAVEFNSLRTEYIYTEVSSFVDGICWVNKGELYAFMDTSLGLITDFVYTDVRAFENSFAMVSRDSTYGFIDQNGTEICALIYNQARNFRHGFAPIMTDSLWGLIDTYGKMAFQPIFDFPPYSVKADFIICSKDGKWGVINSDKRAIYPFEYDFITSDGMAFKNGRAYLLGAR